MKKEMLINCLQPEEIRIAILENGILEELYVERASAESYVGNIYKGRVVNIEPSIQAAFVDFGVGRNGFLHVSDVEPAYYKHLEQQQFQRGRSGERGRGGRPSQRHYDDYDAPQRRGGGGVYSQPKPEQPMEDEVVGPPTEASPAPAPVYYQPPVDAPSSDLPDIIVEEIVEEDEFTSEPAVAEPMQEPASAFEGDWPAATESRQEMSEELTPPGMDLAPLDAKDSVETPLEETSIEEGAEPESAGSDEEEIEEGKAKRKGPRRAKGKTSRAKKPRKRAAPDDAGAKAEDAPVAEPKPRPMDSSERRTDEDDPSHPAIDPRPASPKNDLTDEDLSFSMTPPPHGEPNPRS
jgi:ribonuclease E